MKNCKFCQSSQLVKYGKSRYSKQRYLCRQCNKVQIEGDDRCLHSNEIKRSAIILYLEGIGLRGCARSLSKIFKSKISFQIVSHWINSAGKFVDEEVSKRKAESCGDTEKEVKKEELAVVELDELYTYIKKNLARIKKQEGGKETIPEYGLLLIGTQVVCLSLK